MSSKHRAQRRRGAPPVALTLTAILLLGLLGYLVVLWSLDPSPTAASETVHSSQRTRATSSKLSPQGLQRLVVYGHSMPAGGGASDVDLAYPVLAAEATGLQLNRSEGGTSAEVAANTMGDLPAAGPQDAVVIHTGMNDIFRRRDEAVVLGREGIERLLSGTSEAGRRVLVLECQPSDWLDTPPHTDLQSAYDAWNDMLREEATIWPGVDVLDTCAEWDPTVFTSPPQYHPNDAGHALIASELAALLQQP